MILLICCGILFASILLRNFSSISHQGYWSLIFFSCSVFVWLGCQGNAGLIEWVKKCSSFFNFLGKVLRNIIVNSLYVWWNLPVKPWGPRLFFVGTSLSSDSILLIIELFRFLISSRFSLGWFCVSRNLSISFGYPICWCTTVFSTLS